MTWHETYRRMQDGVTIQTQECGLPGWIHVMVIAQTGAPMFTGTIPMEEAFAEIPFQLDRAREFARLLAETSETDARS